VSDQGGFTEGMAENRFAALRRNAQILVAAQRAEGQRRRIEGRRRQAEAQRQAQRQRAIKLRRRSDWAAHRARGWAKPHARQAELMLVLYNIVQQLEQLQ
jgi:hypothetical protein